jgi:flagellar biosynthesis chaperone FliJ
MLCLACSLAEPVRRGILFVQALRTHESEIEDAVSRHQETIKQHASDLGAAEKQATDERQRAAEIHVRLESAQQMMDMERTARAAAEERVAELKAIDEEARRQVRALAMQ